MADTGENVPVFAYDGDNIHIRHLCPKGEDGTDDRLSYDDDAQVATCSACGRAVGIKYDPNGPGTKKAF